MRLRLSVLMLTLGASTVSAQAFTQDSVRQKAEQACYNNVMKFCNDEVPDEDRIAACLGRNKAKLDPDCRTIYDKGM